MRKKIKCKQCKGAYALENSELCARCIVRLFKEKKKAKTKGGVAK